MIAIILYYYIYIIIYREKTKARRREGQRLDGLQSFPPRPRPLPSPPSGDKGKAEQKSKKKGRKRERTSANDTADLFARSSPLLLLRLMSSPSTSSQPLTLSRYRKRKWKDGHPSASGRCNRHHIATPRHRLTSSNRAVPRRSAILPAASSSSSSSPPSGSEGRAESQPGRATPKISPRRPSPPCRGRPTAPRLALLEVLRAYSTDPDELTLSQAT